MNLILLILHLGRTYSFEWVITLPQGFLFLYIPKAPFFTLLEGLIISGLKILNLLPVYSNRLENYVHIVCTGNVYI